LDATKYRSATALMRLQGRVALAGLGSAGTRGLAISAAVPVQFAAITIDVAILMTQFTALMARGGIVSVVQIASQLAAIVFDLRLVVADVAVQASVTVPG
jgi:hypothetical protein